MKKHSPPILLTPGPIPLCPHARGALSEHAIHHRSREFVELFRQAQKGLKRIFQTQQIVLTLNASGTGAMSSALLNTLSPGDHVLAVCAGKFGERWKEMAEVYHLHVQSLSIPWGEAVGVGAVHQALQQDPQIKAVLIQACETSTGVWHPVQEVAALTQQRPGTLCIVDSISAVGAVPIPMDAWGIDILIGGSQKSFALPAGMSFVALSEKAWQFNANSRLPVYYFDLKKEKIAQLKGQTAFSSNVAYIRALSISLQHWAGYLEQRWKHIHNISELSRQFFTQLGLDIFAKKPSPSMTSVSLPPDVDGVELQSRMETQYGVMIGGGQADLKGRIIRIGHLSPMPMEQFIDGLTALAHCLQAQAPQLITDERVQKSLQILKNNQVKRM